MSKKFLSSVIVSLMTTSALAAVDCVPFKEEAKVKKQIVDDFSYELQKMEQKVTTLEDKIAHKQSQMSGAQFGIDQAKDVIAALMLEERSLNDAMASVTIELQNHQMEADQLIRTINETQQQLDYLPGGSQARRTLLRENNRAKKILEKVQQKIASLSSSIAPQQARLSEISGQKRQQHETVRALEEQKEQIANEQPTLVRLLDKKEKAQAQLINQDAIQQENIKQLQESEEKVLMCKTYNVKYPVALDVAKELYAVGCDRYQVRGFKGKFKQDAEAEVLNSVCQ